MALERSQIPRRGPGRHLRSRRCGALAAAWLSRPTELQFKKRPLANTIDRPNTEHYPGGEVCSAASGEFLGLKKVRCHRELTLKVGGKCSVVAVLQRGTAYTAPPFSFISHLTRRHFTLLLVHLDHTNGDKHQHYNRNHHDDHDGRSTLVVVVVFVVVVVIAPAVLVAGMIIHMPVAILRQRVRGLHVLAGSGQQVVRVGLELGRVVLGEDRNVINPRHVDVVGARVNACVEVKLVASRGGCDRRITHVDLSAGARL
mmetsp:Transcript_40596/g.93317  ORF Transcript_40596/g.93317 Transcript_40596/m.93317 type:complete len:257 (-) Transcript_40596:919-1689(-)